MKDSVLLYTCLQKDASDVMIINEYFSSPTAPYLNRSSFQYLLVIKMPGLSFGTEKT